MDISKFSASNILVVGDLMIDEYLWGEVDRISPEAPVQVVSVKQEGYTLGGAGNVINNIIALGATVSAVGVIGTGPHGGLLLEKFHDLNVQTDGIIQEPDRPTTQKTRIIAANQHVLRIDRETRNSVSDLTFEKIIRSITEKMPGVDLVLISDYGKGLITRSLIEKIVTIAEKHDKAVIADPKGLDFSKYSGVSLITPNKKEAAIATGIEIFNSSTLEKAGKKIINTTGINNVLITCGKEGMVLFRKDTLPSKVTAKARQVYDVSGAGDTVIAVMGLALASGASFKTGMAIANTAAGIVVGKVGTATVSLKELESALNPLIDGFTLKYKHLSELGLLIKQLKQQGRRVVLTNGCFDLLHAGHILLFSASKQLGDVLIVAIDDDESVQKLKGPMRPVIGAKERVRILSALDTVDYVVVFASDDLEKLIEIIQPDILTKGSNYSSDKVFGRKLVEKHGGRVVLIPVTEKISSTRIINNIKHSPESVD